MRTALEDAAEVITAPVVRVEHYKALRRQTLCG
jgi:hypothetical protein